MYQNKQNGKVAVKMEYDDKYKTYLLTLEDGKTQNITSSTFKRWWKEIPDVKEVTAKAEPVEKVVAPNEKTIEKPKVKKEAPAKKGNMDIATYNDIVKEWANKQGDEIVAFDEKFFVIKANGHRYCRASVNSKGFMLFVADDVASKAKCEPTTHTKNPHGCGYRFTDKSGVKLFNELLQASRENLVNKKTSKTKEEK